MAYKLDLYLHNLKELLKEMSDLALENTELAFSLIGNHELAIYERIKKNEDIVNHLEQDIESLCFKIILRTQPVASDILEVETALKVITDFERISDQALDLAKLLKKIKLSSDIELMKTLKEMSQLALIILEKSIHSLTSITSKNMEFIYLKDKEVNEYLKQVKKEIVKLVKENEEVIDECLEIVLIAKYIEKIADHAKNIVEWGVYQITGIHKSDEIE